MTWDHLPIESWDSMINKITRLGLTQDVDWRVLWTSVDFSIVWIEGVTPPDQATFDATPDFPVVRSVSAVQGLTVLDKHGWYDQVATIVNGYPRRALIWYQRAQTWDWDNPYLAGIAIELSLTDDLLDALFYEASLIEA